MALSAPIPIIEGSQTEFSKVWIRGSTATSTLPNLRFYKADGRIVHPVAAALNITIVHTAADTLYNRIQAAITLADSTKNAAWVAKWFGKHQIVGVTSDAITGDTLLVNRAETTGITASNDEPTARVAADFFAQEQYAVGTMFRHGILPGDQSGLNGATVNVSGEVLTSASYAQGTLQTATLLAVNDALTIACEGMGQAIFDPTAVTSTITVAWEVSFDAGSTWRTAKAYISTSAQSVSSGSTTSNLSAGARITVDAAGATHARLRCTATSGGGTPSATVVGVCQASAWNPTPYITSGGMDVLGRQSHDSVATTFVLGMGGEARSTDGTAVASGDAVRLQATLLGKTVVYPYAIPASTWNYAAATGGIANNTPVEAKAGVASTFQYVTSAQIVNMSTTAVEVEIRQGTTALWRCELDADGGASGVSCTFPVPLRGASAAAINVYTSGTGKVFFNLQGYSALE